LANLILISDLFAFAMWAGFDASFTSAA